MNIDRPVGLEEEKVMGTREKILEAAYALFVKKGYTASSIREIAIESGIGKATVYHHFSDKDSIALELLNTRMDEMTEMLKSISGVDDPIERLKTAVTRSMKSFVGSVEIFQIVRREIPQSRQKMEETMSEFFTEYMRLIKEALENGMERGIFRTVDSRETARIFLSMLQGTFASAYLTGQKPSSPEKVFNGILDIFMNGVLLKKDV